MIPVDGKEGPADVCVVELGGTIGKHTGTILCMQRYTRSFPFMFKATSLHTGDIESMPFIEALGQFSYRVGNAIL